MSMSKQIKSSSNEQASYGWGFILGEGDKSFIEGRLLTFLESLGLKDSQEKAAKDILRQEVQSWFYPNALGISGEINTAVQNLVHRLRKHQEEKHKNSLVPQPSHGFSIEMTATEKE